LYFNTTDNVLKVFNGSSFQTIDTLTTGISSGNVPVFTSGVADDDFLRVNGTSIEGRSASEVLSDIGAGTGDMSDLVDDTSPQLGGNLDVNGNSIVSASNANISITPNGSGKVIIDGLSHPTSDGSNGQAIVTNGSGTLSFGNPGGGSFLGDSGGGLGDIIRVHENELNTSITVATNTNGLCAGSLTVASGATLTVNGTLVIV
tara:strand:+ start:357 stop:965 length:609 start_codon:yes stop_codon:yes gene_type:complete